MMSGGDRHPSASRRFTLVDAMILIAAVGLAMVPMRDLYLRVTHGRLPVDPAELGWPFFCYEWAEILCITLRPLVLTVSAALWLARLRQPRPPIRRVFRQPGMAATTAVLASFVLGVLTNIVDLLVDGFPEEGFEQVWVSILVTQEDLHVGKAVLAVWIVLWLGRACRAERSWIDRAGRLLGWYCLVETALFGPITY